MARLPQVSHSTERTEVADNTEAGVQRMPKSAAFIRIKADVLAIVQEIPFGRVCTYACIGQHLDVMARHVAYILATLTDDERDGLPWHRVVAASGAINRTKHGRGAEQRTALMAEGVAVSTKGIVANLDQHRWNPQ
jgi:methylated-DNA-protein-cysteine methyltransferase-like protein